ncbi:MAG: FixH family protein [Gammaproteobacteria bacterium]|nr:FixH family protein [Gammaproteobacteria bacterium]
MIVHRATIFFLTICAALLLLQQNASAHGGVVEEDDLCVIKVNYLSAHFKIYQPEISGHKQYCEDLPVAAESLFVMEYQHNSLSMMPIDFRIIRDVTGKGRFARMEDIELIDDIEAVTVFYRPAALEPAVYTVMHEFEEEGDFVGIVSATHPDTGKVYAAVFPFEVGFTGFGYWPFIVALLVFIQFQFLLMSGRLKRWFGGAATASLLGVLLFPLGASAADLQVSWTIPDGEPQINRIQSWVLHIETAAGDAVEGATVEVTGGMPEHNHGLPTRPRISEEIGGGDYRLSGMRFHMAGYWEIKVTVTTDNDRSVVIIPLQL